MPQGVALEVEEDVTGTPPRKPEERVGVDDLGPHDAVRLLLELEARLLPQAGEGRLAHVGHRVGAEGELLHRPDAHVEQPAARRPTHPGDEQEVAGGLDLGLARLAPPAGQPAGVAPRRRFHGPSVVGEEVVESLPARPVDRQDVVERVVTSVAAADDEACHRGGGNSRGPQQRGIRGDLEEGGNARGARELGVADEPALRGALEEVGVTDEAAVEERRLVDHLGVGVQRVEGLGVGSLQLEPAVPRPAELHDPTTVLRDEPAQLGLLVLVAQLDDPGRHGVVRHLQARRPTEGDVELADERELAACGRAQVARAQNEATVVAEEEHARKPTDAHRHCWAPRRGGPPAQIQLGNHIRQRHWS